MQREFAHLIKNIQEYSSNISEERMSKAFDFASKAYEGHKRFSGDPVLSHALESAKILSKLKVDEDTLIAALLHEIPEYSHEHIKDIDKNFGKNVGELVAAFDKIGTIKASLDENEMEKLRKMFLVMARDLRVVLIKLADRLHNMQTLEFVKPEKRRRIARETLEVYVPIASRLGVYTLRSQLEDLCFKFLNEREFKHINEELKSLGKKRKNTLEKIQQTIIDFLSENSLEGEVYGRFKNTYSIFKKLKVKGKTSIDDIQDIYALRIILPTKINENGQENVEDLYNLIGLIHKKWEPLTGRFKDYIGFPKPNGYKSLHTTVLGIVPHSNKEPVEIQIRSQKMHEEAEYGIASHWLYKQSKGSAALGRQKAHMEWIKSLQNLSINLADEKNKDTELSIDFFKDRIFVFTPNGDIKDLPVGATPLDFAYIVHTDLGHKCIMAKANGNVVPLDYELQNGEVIEILTRSHSIPKLEWLSFVKTGSAQNKIKAYFRSLNKEENFKIGKELLNKQLKRLEKPLLDQKLQVLDGYSTKKLTLRDREHLVESVGNGSLLASQVIRKIFYDEIPKKEKIKEEKVKFDASKHIGKYIIVGGEKGMPIKIAQCCKPSFGQSIEAYASRGQSISIHRKNCKILYASNPERHISAKWVGIYHE